MKIHLPKPPISLFLVALPFVFGASAAHAASFAYEAKLTYDATKTGTVASPNFPALVYASDASLKLASNGGYVASSTGADIEFFTDGTLATQIPSQIDYYDSAHGVLWAYVSISSLSTTSNGSIYVAVGNPSPPARMGGVWDSSYRAVWEFGNGTTLDLTDSTGNGNTLSAVNSPQAAAGEAGGAAYLYRTTSPSDNYLTAASSTSLNITGKSITWEGWVRRTAGAAYGNLFSYVGGTGGYEFALNAATSSSFTACAQNVACNSFGALAQDTNWHYLTLVSDSAHVTAYVDGSPTSGVAASSPIPSYSGSKWEFGPIQPSGDGLYFDGVRISSTNRSASWDTASYNDQSNPGNISSPGFWTWGSWTSNFDYACSGPSGGYDLQVSAAFTCSKTNGNSWSAGQSVTISDGYGSQGGTIASGGSSGAGSLTITPGATTAFTFTYTPVAVATVTLSYSNGYQGTDPPAGGYVSSARALSISGCASGSLGAASAPCTLTASGTSFDVPATVTLSDGGNMGSFTAGASSGNPLTVTLSGGPSVTFTYNPYLAGEKLISAAPASGSSWSTGATSTLFASSPTDASTFTAAQDGNWNSSSTWTCSVGSCASPHLTPDTGDTVVITGHHVTIPSGVTAYMGTCPANNATYDLTIAPTAYNGTSGELEVASGAKLWLCGNYELAAPARTSAPWQSAFAVFKLDTGSTFVFDNNNNSTLAYRGIPANTGGWNNLIVGTLGDTCTFGSPYSCPTNITPINNATANPVLFAANGTSDNITYQIYGAAVKNCGSSLVGCLEYETGNVSNSYALAGTVDIEGSVFDGTGTFQSPASGLYGAVRKLTFKNDRFLNDLAGVGTNDSITNGGSQTDLTNTCLYEGDYFSQGFYTKPNADSFSGCSFIGNVFADDFDVFGDATAPMAAFTDNVWIGKNGLYKDGYLTVTPVRNIMLNDTTDGSAHGNGEEYYGYTENICEVLGVQVNNDPHCAADGADGGGANPPFRVIDNLSLPNTGGDGFGSGQWTAYNTTLTGTPSLVDHNGFYGNEDWVQGVMIGHNEKYFTPNQTLQSYRDNVHWAPSVAPGNFGIRYEFADNDSNLAAAPSGNVNKANIGWNSFYNSSVAGAFLPSGSAGVGITGVNDPNCPAGSAYLGTPYSICEPTKASPDNTQYDLMNTDPKVIDNTRNVLTWASRLYGQQATTTGMLAALRGCQNMQWCVEQMRTWIDQGFQPTNLALKGKADDGKIVGFAGTYGSGYGGTCSINVTPTITAGGTADLGTGFAGTCSFDPKTGAVTNIQVTNPGSNYLMATPAANPAVAAAAVTVGGTCTGACVAANLTAVISPSDIGPVQMDVIGTVQ